jgi:hypothetical protein
VSKGLQRSSTHTTTTSRQRSKLAEGSQEGERIVKDRKVIKKGKSERQDPKLIGAKNKKSEKTQSRMLISQHPCAVRGETKVRGKLSQDKQG